MTVISETPVSIKIFLTKYEVKKYFSGFENIVFTRKEVKETVLAILSVATSTEPFEKGSNLCLEVFETSNGGCILSYIFKDEVKTSAKNLKIKNKNFVYTFGFKHFEDIINLSKALTFFGEFEFKSSVFYMGKKYYAVIDIPEFDNKTPIIISEFADFSARGKIMNEILCEYGKCLFEKNAINQIKKTFI